MTLRLNRNLDNPASRLVTLAAVAAAESHSNTSKLTDDNFKIKFFAHAHSSRGSCCFFRIYSVDVGWPFHTGKS